jgi:hypothetical protein
LGQILFVFVWMVVVFNVIGGGFVRGSGPKNVKFSNCTYIKSDMPESIKR